jgi:disulfide bond formation protein DsbB|tara:strand:+ start:753 stop:1091 length:339 start_codon:yes stop_codon:yes gene_type:complete
VLIITINIIIKKFEKIIFFILAIIFLLTAFLSFYHFGIEQGFFQESMVCNLTNETDNPSKEEILKLLKDKTISCKDVSFRIFGLSLATINTLLSLFISIINFKSFFNYEKNK